MTDLDTVDLSVLARYWAPEVWFNRVGTLAERNNRYAPIAVDGGPRGELRSGGACVPTGEAHGELSRG